MATALKNLSEVIGEIPSGKGKKVAIVVAEWNHEITFKLLGGAVEALEQHETNDNDILIEYVPGCFELPMAAQTIIQRNEPDAVICLGCVIQGDTPHFEYVCQGVTHGLLQVSLKENTPVIFGILTVNSQEQAEDRAGGKHGNKGVEAGLTALKMMKFKNR